MRKVGGVYSGRQAHRLPKAAAGFKQSFAHRRLRKKRHLFIGICIFSKKTRDRLFWKTSSFDELSAQLV